MRTSAPRSRLAAAKGLLAVLVLLGAGAPAIKTFSLLRDWPWWTRQPLVAGGAVLVAVVVVLRRDPRALSVRDARPASTLHAARLASAAVGLLPVGPTAWTKARVERLLFAAGAAAAAVLAAARVDALVRMGLLVVAALLLAILVDLECWRQRAWRDGQLARPPDRAVAWTFIPLVVSAGVTAAVLAAQGREGALSWPLLAELVLVTAFGEELLFRGALLSVAYRALRPVAAEVATAVSFGFWHLGDALVRSRAHPAGERLWMVLGTVAFTALGGLVFSWLRHRTRSLGGPTLGHVATNLPGIALG